MPNEIGQMLKGENQWVLGHAVGGPTDEQAEVLLEERAKGFSPSGCAAAADVSKHTLLSWVNRGEQYRSQWEDGDELTESQMRQAVFAELWGRASAKGARHLQQVSTKRADEGMGTWSEAVTKLERGWRDEFGKFESQQQGGVQIVIAGMLEPRVQVREVAGADVDDREALRAAPAARELPP